VYRSYLLHHRADLFDDPETFDPNRWGGRSRSALPRTALTSFGTGARKCIGDQFGITDAVLALDVITSRWRLRPLAGQRVRAALAAA
jgi:cytochrome P450